MTNLADVKLRANFYRIRGNMRNGYSGRDENGKPIPFIQSADYTRRITNINYDNGILYCECGREFLIDDALTLEDMKY